MSENTSVKVEGFKEPPAPIINENGVKIYPTSFIPVEAPIEPSRIPKTVMTGLQIEVIHVVLFFLITIGLFYTMWKRPGQR